MKTKLRNQKGITLVALVVTIIVLLILAGVSLSLVAGGNGIIRRSANAVSETNFASAKEQTELTVAELQTEYYERKYVNADLPDATTTVGEYVEAKLATKTETSTGDFDVIIEADKDGNMKIRAYNKKTTNGVDTAVAEADYSTATAKITNWVDLTRANNQTSNP